MGTLYELTDEYIYLLGLLEDPEVDDEIINDTLEGLTGEIEVKAEGYVRVIRQMEADALARKEEAKRLTEAARTYENGVKRLKDYLFSTMKALDMPEINTGIHKLKIVNNGGKQSLWTDDVTKIPEEYIKVIKEPDNDKIRDYLTSLPDDVTVEWAHLEPRGQRLNIK